MFEQANVWTGNKKMKMTKVDIDYKERPMFERADVWTLLIQTLALSNIGSQTLVKVPRRG